MLTQVRKIRSDFRTQHTTHSRVVQTYSQEKKRAQYCGTRYRIVALLTSQIIGRFRDGISLIEIGSLSALRKM